VERTFSRARLLLPHTCSRLSAQSIRAVLCLGEWSQLGLVKDSDIKAASQTEPIDSDDDVEMDDGWDSIDIRVD
jgi:hypothetical protein